MKKLVVILLLTILGNEIFPQSNCVSDIQKSHGEFYYVSSDTLLIPCEGDSYVKLFNHAYVEFRGKRVQLDGNVKLGAYNDGKSLISYDPTCTSLEVIEIVSDVSAETLGEAYLEVTGGKPPYAYEWSNGDVENNLVGVSSGIYYYTVSDFYGTELKDSIELSYVNSVIAGRDFWVSSDSISQIENGELIISLDTTGSISRVFINSVNGELSNTYLTTDVKLYLSLKSRIGNREIALFPLLSNIEYVNSWDNLPNFNQLMPVFPEIDGMFETYDLTLLSKEFGLKNILKNGFVIKYLNETLAIDSESVVYSSSRDYEVENIPRFEFKGVLERQDLFSDLVNRVFQIGGPSADFESFSEATEYFTGRCIDDTVILNVFPKSYNDFFELDRLHEITFKRNGYLKICPNIISSREKPRITLASPILIEGKRNVEISGLGFEFENSPEYFVAINASRSISIIDCDFLTDTIVSLGGVINNSRDILFDACLFDTCVKVINANKIDMFCFKSSNIIANDTIFNFNNSSNIQLLNNKCDDLPSLIGANITNSTGKIEINGNAFDCDFGCIKVEDNSGFIDFANNYLKSSNSDAIQINNSRNIMVRNNTIEGNRNNCGVSVSGNMLSDNGLVYVYHNDMRNLKESISIDGIQNTELSIHNNALIDNEIGLSLSNMSGMKYLSLLGNVVYADSVAVDINDIQGLCEIRSNTFINDNYSEMNAVIHNVDSVINVANIYYNHAGVNVIYFESLPSYFVNSDNNYFNCDTCNHRHGVYPISVKAGNLGYNPQILFFSNEVFDVRLFGLKHNSPLLQRTSIQQGDEMSVDLLGNIRDSIYDIGAIECGMSKFDGYDIEINLDFGYIFHPDRPTGTNSLIVEGVDSYYDVSLDVFGYDVNGEFSQPIKSINYTGGSSIVWDGKDSSGQLVPEGYYKYSLNLNDSIIEEVIFVDRD